MKIQEFQEYFSYCLKWTLSPTYIALYRLSLPGNWSHYPPLPRETSTWFQTGQHQLSRVGFSYFIGQSPRWARSCIGKIAAIQRLDLSETYLYGERVWKAIGNLTQLELLHIDEMIFTLWWGHLECHLWLSQLIQLRMSLFEADPGRMPWQFASIGGVIHQ